MTKPALSPPLFALVTILPAEWQGLCHWGVGEGAQSVYPEAGCMVGRTGHRPTLRQVPEVCNLLRHLNRNEKLVLEGTADPT